jgi:hypothetical protein
MVFSKSKVFLARYVWGDDDKLTFVVGLFDYENNQVPKGYLVDALALRGDEGRGTLR